MSTAPENRSWAARCRKYSSSTWVKRVTPFSRVLSCPGILSKCRGGEPEVSKPIVVTTLCQKFLQACLRTEVRICLLPGLRHTAVEASTKGDRDRGPPEELSCSLHGQYLTRTRLRSRSLRLSFYTPSHVADDRSVAGG